MKVAKAALNKLEEAYYQNGKILNVTVTKMKSLDLSACRAEGDSLILAFMDGTEEVIHDVHDYHYTLEQYYVSDNVFCSEMIVEIEGEEKSICACGEGENRKDCGAVA